MSDDFDPYKPPTAEELQRAADVIVKDENGNDCRLGDLWKDQPTVVLFIRHFFCGLCQDFLSFLSSKVKPSDLQAKGAKLIVVGCGDWKLIPEYRGMLGLPFPVYADYSKESYIALGMTRRTLDGGTTNPEYLGATSMLRNTIDAILKAFRMGPFKKSGDIKQLGGEFVIGPGNEAFYTHRMETTKVCPSHGRAARSG